jgi:hypothetical protein
MGHELMLNYYSESTMGNFYYYCVEPGDPATQEPAPGTCSAFWRMTDRTPHPQLAHSADPILVVISVKKEVYFPTSTILVAVQHKSFENG